MMPALRFVAMFGAVLGLVLAAGGATRPATQGKGRTWSDATKTFIVTAPATWRKNEQLEKASKQIALALGHGRMEEGKVQPTFFVLNMGEAKGSLDEVGNAMIESAKGKQPDQRGIASVESAKLDGEDARVVSYLLKRDEHIVRVRAVLARHEGVLYVMQFFAGADDWAKSEPLGKEVGDTFKWSKPQ